MLSGILRYKALILISLLPNFSLLGQCYPDRHSTTWFDGWVSCEAFPNPNAGRGLSHWIMYDFGKVYSLHGTHIWSTNDPANLDRGLKNVVIDYSLDGNNWVESGEYVFEKGEGISTYEGFEGPDLKGVKARYLLVTAVDNYGGACFGLSEMRIDAEDSEVTDVEDLTTSRECFQVQTYP
ncbi:MAG: discoidin domain-containing protein, partial [Saprospiraceae bacterium]|nr:discoidin domain-containing protein [Saprospiraceae bacterium]